MTTTQTATTVLDRLVAQGHVETDWMIHFTWVNGYGDTKNVVTGVKAMTQALAIMSARDRIAEIHLIERATLVKVERYIPGTFRSEVTYNRRSA